MRQYAFEDDIGPRKRRLWILFGVITFIFVIIICRLVSLQVYWGHECLLRSERNFLRDDRLAPERGKVLDCHGTVIASSRVAYDIVWQGDGRKLRGGLLEHVKKIEHGLDIAVPMAELIDAESSARRAVIASDISFQLLLSASSSPRRAPGRRSR